MASPRNEAISPIPRRPLTLTGIISVVKRPKIPARWRDRRSVHVALRVATGLLVILAVTALCALVADWYSLRFRRRFESSPPMTSTPAKEEQHADAGSDGSTGLRQTERREVIAHGPDVDTETP